MHFSNVTNNTLSTLFEGTEIISPNLDKYLLDDKQISFELGRSIQNKSLTPHNFHHYFAMFRQNTTFPKLVNGDIYMDPRQE